MVQALPQIVAGVLGLRPEDVIVRTADTDGSGYDVGVGGGRTTVSLGAASLAASVEVRRKLLDVASAGLNSGGGGAPAAAPVFAISPASVPATVLASSAVISAALALRSELARLCHSLSI